NEVSKDTRAVKIRASIPNPETKLKSDMLVTATLEIPPVPGQTLIPRLAMVAVNGRDYVFVQVAGDPDKYERRVSQVAKATADRVVVADGLKAGETVVSNGSLILAQLYEDMGIVESGRPIK